MFFHFFEAVLLCESIDELWKAKSHTLDLARDKAQRDRVTHLLDELLGFTAMKPALPPVAAARHLPSLFLQLCNGFLDPASCRLPTDDFEVRAHRVEGSLNPGCGMSRVLQGAEVPTPSANSPRTNAPSVARARGRRGTRLKMATAILLAKALVKRSSKSLSLSAACKVVHTDLKFLSLARSQR